jgi:hypothetical protein
MAQPASVRDQHYGGARPDVAAAFGSGQFAASGFSFLYPTEFQPGGQNATVSFVDTLTNQTMTASVIVNALPSARPFGVLDTPAPNARVSGDMPLTGWVLDDVGILGNIYVYRNALSGETPTANAGNRIFVGVATQVPGARPDVQAAFPGYPRNDSAGFGAMILTNALPNGGNGTFTFTVDVADFVRPQATFAARTVIVDNAGSPLPFGAIDSPAPGETISGDWDITGWALTPQPSAIPFDGSTIDVVIDNVVVGHATYNVARPDVKALFPGPVNADGPGAYLRFDTRTLANGLHTISWVVRDDAGHTKGIGSRYFTVTNP